jgi:hypothetical protein
MVDTQYGARIFLRRVEEADVEVRIDEWIVNTYSSTHGQLERVVNLCCHPPSLGNNLF